ncbi:hydrolase [Spirochaetia bacterium]|nr:hydrolase [Spirochaetia bacterium]
MFDYILKNCLAVQVGGGVKNAAIHVKDGKFATESSPGTTKSLDLGGKSFVYPALINTHDHLRGNYLPRIGPKPGEFYLTWLPWDDDLKASAAYAERANLTAEDMYTLSSYKSLFSGVTTVVDHFPHSINQDFLPHLPVRALQNYALAHEASSYDLKWGDGIAIEHRRAAANNWPFITHLAEGFDEESMRGLANLENLGALDRYGLFVHCIGFSDEDIRKTARAGASISWCPASNMLMFNVTCKIRKFLREGVNVTLGTDSTHSGSANLLAEIHYGRELYRKLYGEDLPAKTIFEMVTINAAKALHLEDSLGSLDEGKLADMLVLRGQSDDPYENLAAAGMGDIEFLSLAGKPLYGELRFLDLFGGNQPGGKLPRGNLPHGYSQITAAGRHMFVLGDPGKFYAQAREKIGFKKTLDFLPFEPGQ